MYSINYHGGKCIQKATARMKKTILRYRINVVTVDTVNVGEIKNVPMEGEACLSMLWYIINKHIIPFRQFDCVMSTII